MGYSCPKCGGTERTKPYKRNPNGHCAACQAAYHAAYRAEHKEEIAAYNAAYDAAHREEKRAYDAAHRDRRNQEQLDIAAQCEIRTWEEMSAPGWQGTLARKEWVRWEAAGRPGTITEWYEQARVREAHIRSLGGWPT